MITKIKFGECLHLLLSSLDISNNRLAKGINVDSSLISRWMNEQRLPSYNSNYIENISNFLSKNILNSIQHQHLDAAINTVCENLDTTLTTKDKITRALLESQGYSLEKKKEEKSKKNTSIKSIQKINLSKEDTIIVGGKNVLSAMLSLIKTASKENCKNNTIISISFNSDMDILKIYKNFISWRDIILEALLNGWTVKFLFKLNHNLNEAVNYINLAKPLIATGRFLPYYYKSYDSFSLGREATIIQGLGALSCLSANQNSEIDCAFYIKNPVGVEILSNNFDAILSTSAKSLIKYYTLSESLLYNNSLNESEEKAGSRFSFKDSISPLIIPPMLLKKLLKKISLSDNEILKELDQHRRSIRFFLHNLQYYKHFDVITLSSFQKIIQYKQLSFNRINEITTFDLDSQDILMLMDNIIYLIKTYSNYEVAFINEITYKNELSGFSSITIKEKYQVHIEYSQFQVSIEEPIIVSALEEHFKEIWKHISPIDKNKKELIKWLKHQLDMIKRSSSMIFLE